MVTDTTPSPEFAVLARTLWIDAYAAEASNALQAARIPCILLKGRGLAELLYPDGQRWYDDADLLVPAPAVSKAESVLRTLGYLPRVGGVLRRRAEQAHAQHWDRARDDAHIDLHVRLKDMSTEPEVIWWTLWEHTVELRIAGSPVRVLDRVASGLTCALHVAAHGPDMRPSVDLELALRLLDQHEWRAASALATSLGAREPFAAGLRFSESGRRLADALGLVSEPSADRVLQAERNAPRGSRTLYDLLSQRTLGGVLAKIGHVLVPPPAEMRLKFPMSRRGRRALAAAYVYRQLQVARRVPQAVIGLARAAASASRAGNRAD